MMSLPRMLRYLRSSVKPQRSMAMITEGLRSARSCWANASLSASSAMGKSMTVAASLLVASNDGCAVGVGHIDDLVAELLKGVADCDRAGGTVCLDEAGVEDVEAGYDEGGARVVEDELRRAVAEVGWDVGAQMGDAPAVVV